MESLRRKKQLCIFFGIAFALPYLLGIVMGVAYYKGIDISVFPGAQMYYPAAAVMLAAWLTRKGDALLPKRFFAGFLVLTALMLGFALGSVIMPAFPWGIISQYAILLGSVVLWILLLTEKKEKRIAYGLKGKRWKTTTLIVLLFLVLYVARTMIGYAITGEMEIMLHVAKNPLTWISLAAMFLNYFLTFTAFFGEEYGWRYYLQPVLQKELGMKRGILVLGIIWGFWHLPINFFYYTSPSMGVISVAGQLVICVALGLFFGWAYLKTDNIWLVVILHFANNNLVPVVTGSYSADVLQNQEVTWGAVLFSLISNGIFFMWVIFSNHYKNAENRLPTMDERADAQLERMPADATGAEPQ